MNSKIKWATRGKAAVLVDGGFGSTGKGLISAWLANFANNDPVHIASCNAGSQAGHTTSRANGDKYVCFHLPTIGVERGESICYINAGAIIDVDSLFKEISDIGVNPGRIVIHPRAAVISSEDKEFERGQSSTVTKLASTQKGVGSALSRKVLRSAKLAKDDERLQKFIKVIDLNYEMMRGEAVTIEVPQGMGLSINHGMSYPHCTSRDCYVTSGLSDAGVHPSFLGEVCMVTRTFPIRVGNIVDEGGVEVGNSGPFYPDSVELDWLKDFPGVTPERTTVTKRVRRIATWSNTQYKHGLMMNRPSIVALTFCDYLSGPGQFLDYLMRMRVLEEQVGVKPHHLYSVGPNLEDVFENEVDVVTWLEKNR